MITSTYLYNAGSYTQLKNALNLQPGFSMEFAQENGFADTWHVAALAEDFPYSGNTVTSNTVESLTLQLVTSRSVFQAFLNRQADLGRSGAYYWQVQYIHPESISALTSGLEEWSLNNSYGLPQGVISANYNSLAMVAFSGLECFYKSYVPGLFCCYVWYVWPIFTIASLREWNCVPGNMEFSAA